MSDSTDARDGGAHCDSTVKPSSDPSYSTRDRSCTPDRADKGDVTDVFQYEVKDFHTIPGWSGKSTIRGRYPYSPPTGSITSPQLCPANNLDAELPELDDSTAYALLTTRHDETLGKRFHPSRPSSLFNPFGPNRLKYVDRSEPSDCAESYESCTSFATLHNDQGTPIEFRNQRHLKDELSVISYPPRALPRGGLAERSLTAIWNRISYHHVEGDDSTIRGTIWEPGEGTNKSMSCTLKPSHTIEVPRFDPVKLQSAIDEDLIGGFELITLSVKPIDEVGEQDTDWISQATGSGHYPSWVPKGSIPIQTRDYRGDQQKFRLPPLPSNVVGVDRRFRVSLDRDHTSTNEFAKERSMDQLESLYGGSEGIVVRGISSIACGGKTLSTQLLDQTQAGTTGQRDQEPQSMSTPSFALELPWLKERQSRPYSGTELLATTQTARHEEQPSSVQNRQPSSIPTDPPPAYDGINANAVGRYDGAFPLPPPTMTTETIPVFGRNVYLPMMTAHDDPIPTQTYQLTNPRPDDGNRRLDHRFSDQYTLVDRIPHRSLESPTTHESASAGLESLSRDDASPIASTPAMNAISRHSVPTRRARMQVERRGGQNFMVRRRR